MRLPLEHHEICLAHYRGVHVVHGTGKHVTSYKRVLLFRLEAVHEQHFREDRRGLCHGQRGVERKHRVLLGEHGMDGVAQFVRQGGHLPGLSGIVGKHPGGQLRRNAVTERAAALGGTYLGINMAFLEHAARETFGLG